MRETGVGILAGSEHITDPSARTFVTLDGLRGIAALAVMFWHIEGIGGSIVSSGYLAVDLFFMLSGFVLAHRYDGRLQSGFGASQFIKMRVIRLYPLYILGCAIGAFVGLMGLVVQHGTGTDWNAWLFDIALSILMLPDLVRPDGLVFRFNVPAWSLFYELTINIVFAFALPRLHKAGLFAIVILSGLALIVEAFYFGSLRLTGTMPYFLFASVRAIFGFFTGVLIHRLRTDRLLPRWSVHPALPMAITLATMFAPGGGAQLPYISILIVMFAYPAVILMGLEREVEGRFGNLMSWLGILSFPLYAIHAPVLSLARHLGTTLHLSALTAELLAVPPLLIAAWPASEYYDKRVRRWLTRFVRKSPKRMA
jgi:peptidoglycan/LPS O-acetylase OafA/YrhL